MLLTLLPEILGNSWVDLNDDNTALDSGNLQTLDYTSGFCPQITILELNILMVAIGTI